jgi:hypothetical protein
MAHYNGLTPEICIMADVLLRTLNKSSLYPNATFSHVQDSE